MKKEKTRPPSTQEQYETVEKMTPVKKILYEEEQDMEDETERKSDEQMIQLEATFRMSKVKSSLLIERTFNLSLIRLKFYSNVPY